MYIYRDGAQASRWFLTAWTFLWRLGTAQRLDLCSLLSFGSDSVGREEKIFPHAAHWLPSLCVGYSDCRNSLHPMPHCCCVFVIDRNKNASCFPRRFHKTTYNQTGSKTESPTNTPRRALRVSGAKIGKWWWRLTLTCLMLRRAGNKGLEAEVCIRADIQSYYFPNIFFYMYIRITFERTSFILCLLF